MSRKTTKAGGTAKKVKNLAPKTEEVKGGTPVTQMLSNVSKTRSEISMTFARNARA